MSRDLRGAGPSEPAPYAGIPEPAMRRRQPEGGSAYWLKRSRRSDGTPCFLLQLPCEILRDIVSQAWDASLHESQVPEDPHRKQGKRPRRAVRTCVAAAATQRRMNTQARAARLGAMRATCVAARREFGLGTIRAACIRAQWRDWEAEIMGPMQLVGAVRQGIERALAHLSQAERSGGGDGHLTLWRSFRAAADELALLATPILDVLRGDWHNLRALADALLASTARGAASPGRLPPLVWRSVGDARAGIRMAARVNASVVREFAWEADSELGLLFDKQRLVLRWEPLAAPPETRCGARVSIDVGAMYDAKARVINGTARCDPPCIRCVGERVSTFREAVLQMAGGSDNAACASLVVGPDNSDADPADGDACSTEGYDWTMAVRAHTECPCADCVEEGAQRRRAATKPEYCLEHA